MTEALSLKGDTEKAKDLILVSYGEIPPENMYLSLKSDKYTVESIEKEERKIFSEITRDMYQTENPDVLVIKGKGSLAKIDISVNDKLWERLAEKGLVRNEESVDRLIFNTDGNNWNRLVIPDKWGNMFNNIQIEDVLTREELLTAKSVADLVIKPENSIGAVENNEKAELSNEIVWTPISETEDENGRATSYSTKYNDKFYWISENADGKYDIEADFGHSILSVGEEYSNFPTRYLAEEAFEDYIEEIEKSFVSEKQALVSFEIFGEEFYFKINEKSVDDILKTANTERPLRAFREMGERISEEEYAEIQQSDSFTYSVEMNFDNDTASIYTVNDGKGGISEADRTDSNVTFDTVKISDYSNTPEEHIAADNLPETKFTSLSDEAKMYLDFHQYVPLPEVTPWGETQSCYELNKGVFRVSTASHGGIMIRSDIADKILSPEARKIGFREKGFHCYEEDCDACVPERELLDKGIMQVPDYYTDGAEKYNKSINEELQEWHTDYWDKREQAIFNARPEEEQAAITGQMSLFGDIPDLEDFPDFTEEENISDNTVTEPVEKSDLPIQEQSSAEVTVEKPTTYCYALEHSQDNITLSTRYSEDISIDDVVSTYLPINFENSPNLQQVSVFEGENEVFVPYNWNKRDDLLSKSKSFDLDGTYYLFESGKLFDKAESIPSAFDKISEVQREAAERFAGSPVSLPEFSYIKGSEERIIDRSILQIRETAETIQQKEENTALKTDYFRITDEHLGEGSKREKFQNNIEAIRTLQLIENEERPATPEEQETLSKYIGWGGLQEAFDENNSAWSKEYSELLNLLSEEEYEAARSTVNDAFYTSPVITQAIYEGLSNIGFEGGEILEPSMGVGNFFGTMPDSIRENSNLAGIEIDSISGRIAQKLYPEANIAINGYEKIKLDKGSFDLAVGNVPFGNHGVNDKTKAYKGLLIHDYFFAKSLDSVRPGGIVAFVTSTGTLDKEGTKVRQMLAQKAELMGAVRLPNNAFQKNAGTQTATDIIFLKKREKPLNIGEIPMDKSCDWVHTKENADGLKINSYFADNPDMVLGKLSDNGRFGIIICTPFEGADLKAQLHEAMKNIKGEYIPLEFQQELDERAEDKYLTATPDIENLTYTVVEDKLYYRVDDNLIPLKESEQHGIIADRRKAMCGLGETVRELLQAQVEDRPDNEIKSLQAELTVKYDKFVKKYGRINPIETPNSRNASGVSRKAPNSNVFKNDVRLPLLQSLEKMEDGQFVGKTEIFTERTIRPHKVAEHVETAHEALILSISENGRIDFDYMEQLTGFEKNKIINDLQGDIFPVPELSTEDNTVYQTSDEYLSGNIYKKIAQAEAKISENPEYEKNIAALTEVLPKLLKATEIDMQLGMTWIDPKIIQQFMYETFETPIRFKEYDSDVAQKNPNAITVNYSGSGKGEVSRTEDNMLVVTGDGRKLGLDQRLYDLNLPDEPQTKLNACVQNVYDIWDKNSDKKSTQLVFCDLGVPQSKEDFKKNGERFDVYADIRSKLIEKGIPEKEIAFIHDAASETEKAKLFAKVRSGDVRVLIGSTQKMGAGTNVQNKLIALHDLDCPWRPADLTQRLGRMVRQGNENDKVDNYRYVTKGTFDAYLYQMVEKKQESIAQIFTSKAIARTCDDIDDMAVDFMQVKMAAVGDDRIRRQMELREDIRSLNMLKNTYLENKYEIENNIMNLPEKIAKTEKIIEGIAADTKAIKAYVPKKDIDGKEVFEMKVGNTLYTDKKEAAEAFMTAMTKAVIGNPKNPTDIAEYKGFKIAVSYDSFAKSYTGHIKGANRYPFDLGSSESGNLTRIDNAIASVPMRIERYSGQPHEKITKICYN